MTTLKYWMETIKAFVVKFQEKKGSLLLNVTMQEGLIQVFVQILCIQIPSPKQILDCIISVSGIDDFDNICNDIKCMAMNCINIVSNFLFDVRPDINIQTSKFYSFLLTGLPLVISSLVKFCKSESISLDEVLNVIVYKK